jgi:hypothetical protein
MTSTPDLEGHPRFWAVAGKPRLPAAVVAWAVTFTAVFVLVVRSRRRHQ